MDSNYNQGSYKINRQLDIMIQKILTSGDKKKIKIIVLEYSQTAIC